MLYRLPAIGASSPCERLGINRVINVLIDRSGYRSCVVVIRVVPVPISVSH